jgi:hypothetical protein
MSVSLESALVSVWQQSLIDKKKIVDLDGETFPVHQTSKSKLKQIDFRSDVSTYPSWTLIDVPTSGSILYLLPIHLDGSHQPLTERREIIRSSRRAQQARK